MSPIAPVAVITATWRISEPCVNTGRALSRAARGAFKRSRPFPRGTGVLKAGFNQRQRVRPRRRQANPKPGTPGARPSRRAIRCVLTPPGCICGRRPGRFLPCFGLITRQEQGGASLAADAPGGENFLFVDRLSHNRASADPDRTGKITGMRIALIRATNRGRNGWNKERAHMCACASPAANDCSQGA